MPQECNNLHEENEGASRVAVPVDLHERSIISTPLVGHLEILKSSFGRLQINSLIRNLGTPVCSKIVKMVKLKSLS